MTPEEYQQAVAAHHAQREMYAQDHTHRRTELFEKLTHEELDLLDTILVHCGNDPVYTAYLRGQISFIQRDKHNICPCGKNHDLDPMAHMLKGDASGVVVPDSPNPVKSDADSVASDPDPVVGSSSDDLPMASAAYDGFLREYGLEQVATYEDGEPHPTGLRCKECYQVYVSLDDRMLRSPGIDGCPGCQSMSGHGGKADHA